MEITNLILDIVLYEYFYKKFNVNIKVNFFINQKFKNKHLTVKTKQK